MTQKPQEKSGPKAALACAVWMSRLVFMATSRNRTVGRRLARSPKDAAIALGVLFFWAVAGRSPVLEWFFVLSLALQFAHAIHPGEGHTHFLGQSVGGLVFGRHGRAVECVLFVLGGLWAGEVKDYAARSYFVIAGVCGLFVLASIRRREQEVKDDLSDGLIEAQGRM